MTEGSSRRWTIHGERVVDDTRQAHLTIASVELPDGYVEPSEDMWAAGGGPGSTSWAPAPESYTRSK
jgi:hypothetical protein